MKVVGIVAEYNPFHNGHAFQIEEAKRLTGADYAVCVMSGNFVQRGGPAIFDKFTRAHMALLGGADLVLEMPAAAAVSSAEVFAECGVSILDALEVVTHISFGCEASDEKEQALLCELAELFVLEPDAYKKMLQAELKKGLSFPQARAKAASEYLKKNVSPAVSVLSQPNNILAIEYLKALRREHSAIEPVLIPRRGDDYHCTSVFGRFPSATALRSLIFSSGQISSSAGSASEETVFPSAIEDSGHGFFHGQLASFVPADVLNIYEKTLSCGHAAKSADYSQILHFALLSCRDEMTDRFSQETELARRIGRLLEDYTDFDSFAQLVKTKNRTLTSVSRYLTQILLGIDTESLDALRRCGHAPYARVLGFKKHAAPLLAKIKEAGRIPLITAVKDSPLLTDVSVPASSLLKTDIYASDLYHIPFANAGKKYLNDYRHPLIYL